MQQKLIVVSMDALVYEDLAYLENKPNFQWLKQNCAMVERVRSIYPTLTYPCHATMATGCYPARHGVVNNTKLIPGVVEPPWNWFHDVYRVKDIFDAAKEKGLTTACVGWPSMGNHPNIDWLVAEIAHTKAVTEEEFRWDYLLTGTSEQLWNDVCKAHIHWRTQSQNVRLFNTGAGCQLIRDYKPDLLLMHLANPDTARHKHGAFSEKLYPALDECDQILGLLRQAIRDSGEDYNLVITADHGQLNIFQRANPNVLFAQNGFLTLDENGNVSQWRAWCHSTGLSATVYVKDPADEPGVYAFLKQHQGEIGCSKVYTRDEAAAEGFAGDFSFVLETDDRTEFGNDFATDHLIPRKTVRGSHGYHPDKGPRPTLLATGPAFCTGAVLKEARLVDGAPTWAAVLGLSLPDAEGSVLMELLK